MVSWTPLSGSSKVLSNHSLLVPDSKVTDAGMYTCTAMNSVGTDSKIVVVSVRGETQEFELTLVLVYFRCCDWKNFSAHIS